MERKEKYFIVLAMEGPIITTSRDLVQLTSQFLRHTHGISYFNFYGDRDLTPEQACDLSVYFGLTEIETDYFLCLVDLSRAATKTLKNNVLRRMNEIRAKSKEVRNLVVVDKTLGRNEKFVFYSDWCYSAIRLLSSVPGYQDSQLIAEELNISIERINEVLKFLLATGLCVSQGGKIGMGPKSTHLPAGDSLVFRHHRNWRELALARLNTNQALNLNELALTYPCSISRSSMGKIKKEILAAISRVDKEMEASKEQLVAYLNIDLLALTSELK